MLRTLRHVLSRQRNPRPIERAVAPIMEEIESRMLLSVTTLAWNGQQIQAEQGQWIVGLKHMAPSRDGDGNVINEPRYTRATASPQLQTALDATGTGIQFDHYLGSEYSFLVDVPNNLSFGALQAGLNKFISGISYLEPNGVMHLDATPNDPNFGSQWGLNNTGQNGGTSGDDIDATDAWDYTTGSPSTVVAVLDTGVNYNHADLASNMWDNPNEIAGNGVDDDFNGDIDDTIGIDIVNADMNPMDDFGHGTEVAGVIAAVGDNSTGGTGVAWNAKILPVKVVDSTGNITWANATTGIRYVNSLRSVGVNVRVINASWGRSDSSSDFQSALGDAATNDVLFVASAGNSDLNIDVSGQEHNPAIL